MKDMSKFKKPRNSSYETTYKKEEQDMTSLDGVGQMMGAVYNASVELTKLIVENRVRNKETLTDEDIFNIQKQSLMNCMPPEFAKPHNKDEEIRF